MSHTKPSFLAKLLAPLSGAARHEAENARLEAFLSAFPGHYCGFARDGSVAYSQGFCACLNLAQVRSPADIQNALSAGDAIVFESFFTRLKQDGIPFTLYGVDLAESRHLKISGARGVDRSGGNAFLVLWVEDVTSQITAHEDYMEEKSGDEDRLSLFEKALEALPWPAWRRDEAQRLGWVNEAYADKIADTPQNIIAGQREFAAGARKKPGKTDIPPGPELAQTALDTHKTQTSEAHVILNGKRKLMRIHEIPLGAGGTLGIAEDVTEREELENDLKRYQATTHELLEQLRTAIGIYNADQRLDFYNSAFAQLWGLEDGWLNTKPKLGEVMEKLREERRLPEQADFPRFKQSWLDMFTGLIDPYEDMLYLPDGSALRMLVVAQSAGGLMMTFEDVTSRLELESSYNTLIAVQKETLDNLGEGVAAFGGDGRLKLWNPSYGRIWNLHPEDLESEPHISRIVEKVKPLFEDSKWAEAKEDMIAMTLDRSMREGRLSRNDGTLVDYSAVPLPDGGVLITFIDVTDSVRVENALREKNAALEAAEKLKLDFLANVSYQLRTPLSAIMGFNDILDQEYFGPLNPRQKEYTRDIQSASNRLLGLINDILDLSTIEAGYMTLELAPVKIKPMLESLVDLTQDWARKEKIEVGLSCPANIGSIEIDERRVKQAMMNLIRNSIAFTPSGGSITIGAKKRENGIVLEVSDTGVGIKRENHLRIFQPFERAQRGFADTAEKGQPGGAGLGLSLVKNIVSLHQGAVELESEPGKGTRVTLFFPVREKAETDKKKIRIALQ